ncbi:MAG: polysaccharide deacetylase family protein [Saccharofermentanales bacterium]
MNNKKHKAGSIFVNRIILLVITLSLVFAAAGVAVGCRSRATSSNAADSTTAGSSVTTATSTATKPAATTAAPTTLATTVPTTAAATVAAELPPSSENPVIALTFDDGPSLRDTGTLLDLLKTEDVKATFFVLGNQIAAGRESFVKRAFAEGHEIGNHTYSHKTVKKLSASEVRKEFSQANDLIEGITGVKPVIARPPTGAYDDTTIAVSKELGMTLVNWSYQSCPEDWNHRGEPDYIADFVIEKARNGHIVLLHDTNSTTVEAMPKMIKGLKEKGFRFMTVSELLAYGGEGEPAKDKVYFQFSVKK